MGSINTSQLLPEKQMAAAAQRPLISPSCVTIALISRWGLCVACMCVYACAHAFVLIRMISCLSYFLTGLLQCSVQRAALEDYLETSASLQHGGPRS